MSIPINDRLVGKVDREFQNIMKQTPLKLFEVIQIMRHLGKELHVLSISDSYHFSNVITVVLSTTKNIKQIFLAY